MLHLQKFIGCMLGGAYGDMLGAAVEFMSLSQIRGRYGENGITVPQPAYSFPLPVITDDTQMALATAHGILAVPHQQRNDDQVILAHVYQAYLVWYASQLSPQESRAPGSTCLSALSSGQMGSISQPLNGSAGCGGVLRTHPVGMALVGDAKPAMRLGMESAAITHGDPCGYVPAGALAMLVSLLLAGCQLSEAVDLMMTAIKDTPGGMKTYHALLEALAAPHQPDPALIIDERVGCTPGKGGGWLGHDALAIALYAVSCASDDSLTAVRIAVNHSGDSDSTGSIAGAIMGALHGPGAFEMHMRQCGLAIERYEELCEVARMFTEGWTEISV